MDEERKFSRSDTEQDTGNGGDHDWCNQGGRAPEGAICEQRAHRQVEREQYRSGFKAGLLEAAEILRTRILELELSTTVSKELDRLIAEQEQEDA